MKRNEKDDHDHHNSEKRTRSGGTITNTAAAAATSSRGNHHQSTLHRSSMEEQQQQHGTNQVASRHTAVLPSVPNAPNHPPMVVFHPHPPPEYPNHFIPYYQQQHIHQQSAIYPGQQQQQPFPAQVLPEDETATSDHYHLDHPLEQQRQQQQPLIISALASIRDEEEEEEDNKTSHHNVQPLCHDSSQPNIGMVSSSAETDDNHNHTDCPTSDNDIDTTTTTIRLSTKEATTLDHPDKTSQDYYFDSYAHHAIHEEMLKDEVRTKTYEMAICQNKHLFHDKIVLDVGCGTGILSMFAARAGAKHIYAVDCSSIIVQAQNIIDINGLSDRITLIRGKVEEIDLPVDTVDIIISEWMGYFLLYESMLDTVLFARDKWLVKTNGIIFPDKAVMYITAIEDGNVRRDRFDYWDDVYGFDMSPIKEIALREPVVDVVDAKSLVTDGVPILSLDILTCTKEDLDFTSPFKLQALRNDYIHGLVAYFECAFTQIHKPIGFSTSPMARYTHWKQTILYLPETLTVCAGEVLTGEISCRPNQRNRRDLDIGLNLTFKGRYSECENKKIPYRLR